MNIAVTHISTACILLEIGSARILTDPVFDTGVTKYRFDGIAPATRFRGPALGPEELPPLDAILLSHAHHDDNLDKTGRTLLPKARSVITERRGLRHVPDGAIGLNWWQSTTVHGPDGEEIRITATPARHGPRWLPYVLDKVCGYVLEWEGQKDGAYYISGDTVYFSRLCEIGQRFKIDTAFFHLGAVTFKPLPLRFTFNAKDAVTTAGALDPKRLIPIHYERSTWSHFKQDVAAYHRAFEDAGLHDRVQWLERGEKTAL